MIFDSLYHITVHNLIKEKLLDLIEQTSNKTFKNKGALFLACNDKKAFSLLQTIEDINFGLVRMYVTPCRISLIIFTLDWY